MQKDEARHGDALRAARDEYERREKLVDAQSEEMLRLLRKVEEENCWLLGELKGYSNPLARLGLAACKLC